MKTKSYFKRYGGNRFLTTHCKKYQRRDLWSHTERERPSVVGEFSGGLVNGACD